MATTAETLEEIRRTAPPFQTVIEPAVRARLVELTAALLESRPDCVHELHRYLSIQQRMIPLDARELAGRLRGRAVVVTGGTGCIGTALLERLLRLGAGPVTSLAVTPPRRAVPGVAYEHVDVCARDAMTEAFRRLRPEVVFHLAAQRDPGLAEQQVARTVATNVLGTRNAVEVSEAVGVRHFVYASTGKALRPYTTNVYAASKRLGEWLVSRVAARGAMACSGARFTHVVDNSIVLDRLARWCRERAVIRLHSADTLFYAQSALESVQLILVALLAPQEPVLRLHMIRDLDWPVPLLDLALGYLRRHRTVCPLYIAGHDPGYEEEPYPGLYDPLLAGDVSPLVNGIEAHRAEVAGCDAVDAVPVEPPDDPRLLELLAELEQALDATPDGDVRGPFDALARRLLVATTRATSPVILERTVRRTAAHRPRMRPEHLYIDDVFRRYAPGTALPAPARVEAPDRAGAEWR